MSLRDRFTKQHQDRRQQQDAVALDLGLRKIDAGMGDFAAELPKALEKRLARDAAGKGPSWFWGDATQSYITCGIEPRKLTPEVLETLPGYRRLRELCASREVDVGFTVNISGSEPEGDGKRYTTLDVRAHPYMPFIDSAVTITQFPGNPQTFSVKNFVPQPLAPDVGTGQPIAVTAPLKLKAPRNQQ